MSKDVNTKVLETVKGDNTIVTLNHGFKVKFTQLPVAVFDAVIEKFPMPEPPEVEIGEKGRKEPNPNDPDYIKECGEVETQRGEAIMAAIYLLCVEPQDTIPEDKEWVPLLKHLSSITGVPDMSKIDLTDPYDRKLMYLKYVAIGRGHLPAISARAHLGEEAIRQAESTFRGDAERVPDKVGEDPALG